MRRWQYVDRSGGAAQDDPDVRSLPPLLFKQDLPASAAGRGGFLYVMPGTAHRDRQNVHGYAGKATFCRGEGHAFGAKAKRIGCILDIEARYDFAIFQ